MASTWAAAGLSDECPALSSSTTAITGLPDGILNLSSNEPSSWPYVEQKFEKGGFRQARRLGETPPVDLDAYEEAESIRMRRSSDTADAVLSWNGPSRCSVAAFAKSMDPDDATSDSFTALDGFQSRPSPSLIFSVLRHASVRESGGAVRHAHQDAPALRSLARAASAVSGGPRRHGGGRGPAEAAAAFGRLDQVRAGLPPSTNVCPI